MAIACPQPQWPTELLAEGPPEDPSILLRGLVEIGGAKFVVTAVRVDPIRFGPDFRINQSSSVYDEYNLAGLLDSLWNLVEVAEASTLQLASGSYVLWMLPRGPTD